MAYLLQTEYESFPVNAYFKIISVQIHEHVTYDDLGGVIVPATKTYVANISTQMYKDSRKAVVLGSPASLGFVGLEEAQLTLEALYTLSMPEGSVAA